MAIDFIKSLEDIGVEHDEIYENLNKTKLIIRHKGKVDETVPGARSRQIQSPAGKTTPIMTLPLDFPALSNEQVTIFDVTTNYTGEIAKLGN